MQDLNVLETDSFTLVNRTEAPELFAEGMSQMMMGHPTTKLILHTIVAPAENGTKEIRKVVTTLSIPTRVAIEMAKIILSNAKEVEPILYSMANEHEKVLKELLSDVVQSKDDQHKSQQNEPPQTD